jgi:hypothetical protein
MKNILKTLSLLLLLGASAAFGRYFDQYTAASVGKDFQAGNTQKYMTDTMPPMSLTTLQSNGIFTKGEKLTRDYSGTDFTIHGIVSQNPCSVDGNYTGTIYDISPTSGAVECMVAKKGLLYAPLGLFTVYYPSMKKHFSLDVAKAEINEKGIIAAAGRQFAPLAQARKDIKKQIIGNGNSTLLNIPQVLLASILTDQNVIDATATQETGKLQLQQGYTLAYKSTSGETVNNADYIVSDAGNIFNVYARLSTLSMQYFYGLLVLFGLIGLGRTLGAPLASKIEGRESGGHGEKHIRFGGGLLVGIFLFFPLNFNSSTANGQYKIMNSKYQSFERYGYYMFDDWADKSALAIIDSELDGIVNKAGIATKQRIIDDYARLQRDKKLEKFWNDYYTNCNQWYDVPAMTNAEGKNLYAPTQDTPFPPSENYAYAAMLNAYAAEYYMANPQGLVENSAIKVGTTLSAATGEMSDFPIVAVSSCNRAYYKEQHYTQLKSDYQTSLSTLTASTAADNSDKINAIKALFKFQYGLYRDYGFLSVLGLPVTKMQTDSIGALYKNNADKVDQAMENQISSGGHIEHALMANIPYLFIPGVSGIYEQSQKIIQGGITYGAIGASKLLSFIPGAGSALGFGVDMLGKMLAKPLSFLGATYISIQSAKTFIDILPIIGIFMVGLTRFIIIIVKVFAFHFASLFLLPVMFARENIKAAMDFSMKILATMMELPLFVLSVWLAITAVSMMKSVGTVFSDRIIIGMLHINQTQHVGGSSLAEFGDKMKIYMYDGLLHITIAIFSAVIAYKIIITLHSMVLELIEVKASQQLDNTIESMKNDVGGHGVKI